jgi:hypothetical protein
VVVRVFDECTVHDRPWVMNDQPPCWDRLPVTIVRSGWPHIYSGRIDGVTGFHVRSPGFVLASTVQSRISCSYPQDTGTSRPWRQCGQRGGDEGCVPGCSGFGSCVEYSDPGGRCFWPADALKEMLQTQDARAASPYGEIILDTFHHPWTDLYPQVIVAVLYQARCAQSEYARARDVRQAFCQEFGLPARCVPLLEYDEQRTEAPFAASDMGSCASCWDR